MSTYAAGAAVPALTGATSEHYTITHNGPPGRYDTGSNRHRPLLYLATGLGCAAALMALAYLLAIGLSEPPAVVRAPLGWGSGVAAVLAGGAFVGAIMLKAIRDQTRAECAAVRHAVDSGVADGVAAVRSLRCEVRQRLGELEQAFGVRLGDLARRVEAVERRVEEQDEEYERGWVDGAAKTAEAMSGNGQVRQLHTPSSGPPSPRRPR